MIKIFTEKDRVYSKIINETKESFDEIQSYFKYHKFKYDPSLKASYCSPSYFMKNSILDYLYVETDIEIKISSEDILKIPAMAKPKPELVLQRCKYKEDLTPYKPKFGFQLRDIQRLICQNRSLNKNYMGAGKTYETIVTMNHVLHYGKSDKVLVVAESNMIYEWKNELLKFSNFFEEDEIFVVNNDHKYLFDDEDLFTNTRKWNALIKRIERGEKARRLKSDSTLKKELLKRKEYFDKGEKDRALIDYKNIKVIIMSYEHLISVSEYYKVILNIKGDIRKKQSKIIPMDKWITEDKGFLICDESHNLANKTNSYYVTLKHLVYLFDQRHFLTYTPYARDILQLWSQINLLDKNAIELDFEEFKRRVAIVGNDFSQTAVVKFLPDQIEKLLEELRIYVIGKTKEELEQEPDWTLPEFIQKKIFIHMNDKHKEVYQKVNNENLQILKEVDGYLKPSAVKQKFPYLIQLASDVSLFKDKISPDSCIYPLVNSWKLEYNSKIKQCNELIKEWRTKDKKIIIWTSHPKTAEVLSEYYLKKGHKSLVLNGKTKTPKGYTDKYQFRSEMIAQFQEDPEVHLAILSSDIFSAGQNIPKAPINIWFDRDYIARKFIQGLGRSLRATSIDDVYVYTLVLEGTIEVAQDYMLDNRVDLNSKLFKRESLTKEEWQALFQGKMKDIRSMEW